MGVYLVLIKSTTPPREDSLLRSPACDSLRTARVQLVQQFQMKPRIWVAPRLGVRQLRSRVQRYSAQLFLNDETATTLALAGHILAKIPSMPFDWTVQKHPISLKLQPPDLPT